MGSSWTRDQIHGPFIGRQNHILYATREVLLWILEPKFMSDSPDQKMVGSRKESTFRVG